METDLNVGLRLRERMILFFIEKGSFYLAINAFHFHTLSNLPP
ncbi:hypothetical protein MHA_0985 [Mannheimia haemolytica PHL213]|nr:hypothetical protein MHA_0985 [Mannheimia haemolytica PHL213]